MFVRELRRQVSFFFREARNSYYRFMGLKIGDNVFISRGAWLDTQDGEIIIEDNVRITNGCKVLSHDYSARVMGKPPVIGRTIIKNGAFLGMNVVVLPGVTIGEGAVIGAGCIVSHDIPADCVFVGAKPRVIKVKDKRSGSWNSV